MQAYKDICLFVLSHYFSCCEFCRMTTKHLVFIETVVIYKLVSVKYSNISTICIVWFLSARLSDVEIAFSRPHGHRALMVDWMSDIITKWSVITELSALRRSNGHFIIYVRLFFCVCWNYLGGSSSRATTALGFCLQWILASCPWSGLAAGNYGLVTRWQTGWPWASCRSGNSHEGRLIKTTAAVVAVWLAVDLLK